MHISNVAYHMDRYSFKWFQALFKPSFFFAMLYAFCPEFVLIYLVNFSHIQSTTPTIHRNGIVDIHHWPLLFYQVFYSLSFGLGHFQPSTIHNQTTSCSNWSRLGELTWQQWQVRMPKEKLVPVPSRQWSCSELVDGHRDLVAAKEERESDDELDQRIQDRSSVFKPVWVKWHPVECTWNQNRSLIMWWLMREQTLVGIWSWAGPSERWSRFLAEQFLNNVSTVQHIFFLEAWF